MMDEITNALHSRLAAVRNANEEYPQITQIDVIANCRLPIANCSWRHRKLVIDGFATAGNINRQSAIGNRQ
jgi:hypothetical protein